MDRLRVLVMNGQRLLESQTGTKWHTDKVQPAGSLKPGIYNIFTAKPAESEGVYSGQIIHSDAGKGVAYQEVGKNSFIQHSIVNLNKVVETGENVSMKYNHGKAEVSPNSVKQGRGIKM